MHFCANDLQFLAAIYPMLPDMIIMGRYYVETLYMTTCNKCRFAIACLQAPYNTHIHRG